MRSAASSLALLAALMVALPAAAQAPQPFNMGSEQGDLPAQPDVFAPSQPSAPMPQGYVAPLQIQPSGEVAQPMPPMPNAAQTPRFTVPTMVPSIRGPASAGGVDVPSIPIAPVAPPAAASAIQVAPAAAAASTPAVGEAPQVLTAATAAPAGGELVRYIIPQRTLRLAGENDQRSWSVFLTANEAAQQAELSVAYKNAIVVMPEASRLRVVINNAVVLETPLSSSDDFKTVSMALPAGLLRAGGNVLRMQAFQRHRTDCSVQSTYELWTDIDPTKTQISFEGGGTNSLLQSLQDLPAVGYGPDGITRIHIVAPATAQGAAIENVLKLSQAIGVLGAYPNPDVQVLDRPPAEDAPGTLTVLLGTGADINPLISAPIAAAATQPVVNFLQEPAIGANVLAITGANWGQVGAAVEAIAAQADRPVNTPRNTLNTAAWLSPDVRLFTGPESVTLASLGVTTQQFSGRRFRTYFSVAVPSDFYAEAYGEAIVLLDAAYTSEVQPASHIDLYVNGQIAATTRIVNRTGGIFRHLPVQIPFRHFRPGVNTIMIEAVLNTTADAACAPGGSIAGSDRFVLFDTSEFSMPQFARIARRPNLAALAGTGAPYNTSPSASSIVLGRNDAETISAAATFVNRLASQAGRVVPLALTAPASVGDQNAIFVGVASQFTDGMLSRLGIAESVRVNWRPELNVAPNDAGAGASVTLPGTNLPDTTVAPNGQPESTDAVFDRWRTALSGGGGWRGQVSSFEDWMKRNFDISFSALRIGPAQEVAFEPKARSTLLLAQAVSPGGGGTWTMMTAPSPSDLAEGARAIAAIETWSEIRGQFSWFSPQTGRLENQPVANYQFVVTQPLSIQNLRLIAANWFSSNIVFYAFCLIGLCFVLGIITSGLLFRLGRPS
jgi:hypothetical protein